MKAEQASSQLAQVFQTEFWIEKLQGYVSRKNLKGAFFYIPSTFWDYSGADPGISKRGGRTLLFPFPFLLSFPSLLPLPSPPLPLPSLPLSFLSRPFPSPSP